MVASGVVDHLCRHLSRLEFEARKDGAMVFNNLLRKRHGGALVAVEYLDRNAHLLDSLLLGYNDAEAAMCTGNMLRECTRCEPLCRRILDSGCFTQFFAFIELDTFEIATDAFSSSGSCSRGTRARSPRRGSPPTTTRCDAPGGGDTNTHSLPLARSLAH